MDDLSQLTRSVPLQIAGLGLLAASVVLWLAVAVRWCLGLPVLPYQPRRQVPWQGRDVLAVLLVLEAPLLIGLVQGALAGRQPTAGRAAEATDVQHPIADLLLADSSATTWLLCIVLAVAMAPIVEELTYRLVLQGWLEAEERRARRRVAAWRRWTPGFWPVVLVSFLFAVRHFRTAGPPMEPHQLKQAMLFQMVWSLLTLSFALVLLRTRSGATAADLGLVREKLSADVGLGLLAIAAVVAPVLLLHLLVARLPVFRHVATDPIPLFFLALLLGSVYYRTHRIVPAIVIHMAFNATSLALFWLQVRAAAAAIPAAGAR